MSDWCACLEEQTHQEIHANVLRDRRMTAVEALLDGDTFNNWSLPLVAVLETARHVLVLYAASAALAGLPASVTTAVAAAGEAATSANLPAI